MGKKLITQNQVQEETEKKCFVPNCTNKKALNESGQRLQFFQVPHGIEGMFWEKAVKIRKRKYDNPTITYYRYDNDLLSSTDYMLGLDDVNKAVPNNYEFCCEVHFDIDADIERIINGNGTVDYKVKPGAVPQIKPKQKKRLCDYDDIQEYSEEDYEMKCDIIKEEESMTDGIAFQSNNFQEHAYNVTTNGYVSIVDISTLTEQNADATQSVCVYEVNTLVEEQPESNDEPFMPMLPLTAAMMKRKSPYYMGLQKNHFLQLLQIAHQNELSDVKVMIALRKLRLNEEFEVLGDLFDLDKTTTERYFDESKYEVIHLVDILCSTAPTTNHIIDATFKSVKADPILLQPINGNGASNVIDEHDDDVLSTTSEASTSYVLSEPDPDVMSEDFASDSDESFQAEKTKECSLCNQWFTAQGLAIHTSTTHSLHLNLNKTTCGLCLQNFETSLLLQSHQSEAHDANAYACDVCGLQYRQKRLIVKHILIKHAEVKTYLCELCGTGFPFQSSLTHHLKRTHLKIGDQECHLCDTKYRTVAALKDHIRAIHTHERPFKCKFDGCGKTFNRANVFRSHSRVHAIDKYECDICSKQFSFNANLRTHKRNIHGMVI